MRVVLGAGGTGGHVFPAIAVADELRRQRPEVEILFIGLGNELERRLLTQAGYRWEAIPFVPITGAGVRGLLRFCLALPGALLRGIAVFR
ncbi:MAG: glycosyltransferase, partial [Bdellovibrionales bacterium]|nr:glycosyltransferase [Bdellovibrionales bacterium]